jgi:hypothetical protein
MGVMAGTAVRLRHRIIHMLFLKVGLIRLVAAHTEGRQIIFQKTISLGRSMRLVATATSFPDRTVFELCFGDSIPNIFVAIKAEFVPRFQKDKLVPGGMRIMALYTIAFHHNFMTAPGILGDDPSMTLIADLVRIFIQQLSVGRGVRIMAFCALSRLHRSVHKWILELFLKSVVAAQT